jgi:antitoxin (DNA-binding transcriptional repressor) of toxin-antitoxin stability system
MDEVQSTGQTVVITKRGKPVARIVPTEEPAAKESPEAIFGCLSHIFQPGTDLDNLVEPIIPLEEWDHLKEDWSPFPSE